MIKRVALTFLCLLLPYFSNAQILNIEKLRLEKDTAKHFLMKLTTELSAYNRSATPDNPVNFFGYNLDFNSIFYPDKHAYTFLGKFDYVELNDANVVNFGFLHTRINFLRERMISYETFAQFSYDDFRGLNSRWITGGSVRIKVFENEKTTLVWSTGAMYEYEKWQVPESDEQVEVNFLKNTNYLSIRRTVNEIIDFNMINYYQTGYDQEIDQFRNRLSSSTILNFKLSKWLSWKNSFDISYEDKPIVDITKLIYTLRTGISLDL
ncbi:DUF481 domain-containing protein [Marivirga sp. S37H4]|uniref:DUF481 domain-containing protein n=2 Tax=Marivirga aurantiaca TaxID=2802615 RepID=A0A934WWQ0_9BACT|nr:DUF481 domain-containing protein [Marivirga aurantiaca]